MLDPTQRFNSSSLVGSFSGYMILETDDVANLHKLATVYSTYEIEAEPIIDVTTAARMEAEGVQVRERLLQRQ